MPNDPGLPHGDFDSDRDNPGKMRHEIMFYTHIIQGLSL